MAAVKEPLPDFSLPPDFFSDSDIFPEKSRKTDTDICFPAEFPYDLCSSPAGSAESDDDEFLAGLTRRLTLSSHPDTLKSIFAGQNHFESWMLSGSPEKTSGRERSWSCRSTGTPNGPSQISSPTTPLGFQRDSWDLILQAAGRVAALQMRAEEESLLGHSLPGHRTFPLFPPPPHKARGVEPFVGNGRHGRQGMVVSCNAASLQGRPYGGAGGSCCGGMKKGRSGTGVFLPRPYGNDANAHQYPMNSRNKAGLCPNARVVPATLNRFHDTKGSAQPRLNASSVSDYDVMLARRNAAFFAQNTKDFRPEIMLPQEWTY